jgi:hypothetical protein
MHRRYLPIKSDESTAMTSRTNTDFLLSTGAFHPLSPFCLLEQTILGPSREEGGEQRSCQGVTAMETFSRGLKHAEKQHEISPVPVVAAGRLLEAWMQTNIKVCEACLANVDQAQDQRLTMRIQKYSSIEN